MNRDDFIITLYCLICDEYKVIQSEQRIRKAGFAPSFTDEEVITLEVCGECFGLHTDVEIYAYFASHYRHFFPKLVERSLFVRQAANLWHVKMRIQQQLVSRFRQDKEAIQMIDTLPIPICDYARRWRVRCLKPEAGFGYCAAKQLHYLGFKLGLRISPLGMITHYVLLPARDHDLHLLDDLLAGFTGVALGDKGFINGERQQTLATKCAIELLTPPKSNMRASLPRSVVQLTSRWRKRIETVAAQLAGRFEIERIRVRSTWHLQHRIIRKVLAHTLALVCNLLLGRPPLDFEGLLAIH
jgi:hypothetical protein